MSISTQQLVGLVLGAAHVSACSNAATSEKSSHSSRISTERTTFVSLVRVRRPISVCGARGQPANFYQGPGNSRNSSALISKR